MGRIRFAMWFMICVMALPFALVIVVIRPEARAKLRAALSPAGKKDTP